MKTWRVVLAFLVAVGVSVLVVGSPIRIGSVGRVERMVVAHLIAEALEARGCEVTISTYPTPHELREALLEGLLDLCVEYTGTVWLDLLSNPFSGESPRLVYSLLEEYDQELDLIWMDPIWCNSTYAVAVTAEFADENNVYDLKAFGEYVASMSGEVPFSNRFDFLDMTDLQTAYNFEFAPDFILHFDDFGTLVTQLAMGNVVGWTVSGTDPAIARNDWVLLSDEKNVFPPYDPAVCVRPEAIDSHPELEDAVLDVVGAFSQELAEARAEVAELNAQVAIDGLTVEQVASSWFERPSTYTSLLATAKKKCPYTLTATVNLLDRVGGIIRYTFTGTAPANSTVTVIVWGWKKKGQKAPYPRVITHAGTVNVNSHGKYKGTFKFNYTKYTTTPWTGVIDAMFICGKPPVCIIEKTFEP